MKFFLTHKIKSEAIIVIASFETLVPLKVRCKVGEGQGKKKAFCARTFGWEYC